ncbi:hypothetical protein EBQ90_03250 [bacterium]|nr:hypothetical protein [bacterium]
MANAGSGSNNGITQAGDRTIIYAGGSANNPGGGLTIAPWRTDVSGMRLDSNGNVGVGVSSPAAKLDVAGEVKFGNTSSTCNATNEGQQRYDSTLKLMQFCNGTAWTGYNQSGPTFSAFPSAEGSTSSPSTKTKILFDQEEFDPESCFDTLNRHFKPTKAGYYQINLLTNLRMSSAGTLTLTLHLYKNGVAHKSAQQLINYNSSFAQQLSISAVVYMNGTTDVLEGYFETNASTAYYQAGKTLTSMSGYYIRP